MRSNNIRRLIQKTGFDFHRYYPKSNRLAWLAEYNIRTVIDVGANVGQFADEIRSELPGAFIYSFEPLKDCFEKLREREAKDRKFKAFNCALGEKEVPTNINRSSYSLSSSLLAMTESHKTLFPHTQESVLEIIKVKRLDNVFRELKPEKEILIKIDTQGYEDKVITGGINAFSAARVAIIESSFIELYENQPLFDDIYEKMKPLGFAYRGALHQKINPKNGEVIFEDAIFVRE